MFTEPRLEGDTALLRKIHNEEILTKNERLYNLGVGERDLASADKFAAILEAEGVEVVYKPGKLKPIPALAKTDGFMQELLDHECERIRELAQARLDVKSTITETRSARLGQMSERGRLCVYLHYCGAHTRRWSGGDDVNFQNLGRRSELRRAIRAPAGYVLAAPDQSQGECRILNWLAGQVDVVERFARGEDPYLPMAGALYGRVITDPKAPERQVGKVVELACGFGMGPGRLAATMRNAGLTVSEDFPELAVKAYRASHPEVVGLWKQGNEILHWLGKTNEEFRWSVGGRGYESIVLDVRDGRLYHPNGTWLDYSRLKWEEGEWRLYGRGGSWRKMYGAKLVENVVQWLSRIVTAEAMVKFDRAGYQIVGMAHDDVWLLVPETATWGALGPQPKTTYKQQIIDIMSETPAWAPGLPLAADCQMGSTYGG